MAEGPRAAVLFYIVQLAEEGEARTKEPGVEETSEDALLAIVLSKRRNPKSGESSGEVSELV